MIYFSNLFIFIFGLAVGSFLNCVIYRLETKESLKGRSFCPHCKHLLSWQDLVPVFSFIILRGHCRYCKGKISFQYPLIELATGFIFLAIYNFSPDLITAAYYAVISSLLIIIFVYDLKHFIIPDKILFPAIALVFLYRVIFWSFNHWDLIRNLKLEIRNFETLVNPLLAATGASMFFLIIFLMSRGRWLGFGDVKFAFFMGLFLGYPKIIVALFLSFWLGAIVGIGLILLKKKTMKSEVPFGPFLITGTFISLFWGNTLLNWYFSFLH